LEQIDAFDKQNHVDHKRVLLLNRVFFTFGRKRKLIIILLL